MTDEYMPSNTSDTYPGTPSVEKPKAEKDAQPKRKKQQKDPTLKTERVLATVKAMGGGPVSISEVTYELYGTDDRTRHGRVNHHMQKMAEDGTLRKTGTTMRPVFHVNDSKPSNTASTGDLFELVGRIGEALAVRSLDTHQIYRLEEI